MAGGIGGHLSFFILITMQDGKERFKKVLSADKILLTVYFMTHILVAVIVALLAIYGGLE